MDAKIFGEIRRLASLVSIVLVLMLFGGQLVRQYDEVALDVPAAIAMLERLVEEHPWGRFVEKFVVHVDFSKMTTPVAQQFIAIALRRQCIQGRMVRSRRINRTRQRSPSICRHGGNRTEIDKCV